MVFIEISSKNIKIVVTFIFRHLVDVMAQCYTINIFESTLNNLKLFFSMLSNSNGIIQSFVLKEKQDLVRAYCFMVCAGPVENLQQVTVMKKWVRETKKKQLST